MSTPTPTPRTDAQNFGASCETDFCRTLERENAALRENCEAHEKYAHMMQEQRSQIAAYCRTLERELAAERAKVRTLREACESICEEWGRNHDVPFLAGNKMDATATAALEKTEDAQ